ncbi:MAG: hypothetical protein NT137_00050 [Methanomassiliicoccales archaeon]|nr:hypothetical protein [Methanomassiliicoccales archaeon]
MSRDVTGSDAGSGALGSFVKVDALYDLLVEIIAVLGDDGFIDDEEVSRLMSTCLMCGASDKQGALYTEGRRNGQFTGWMHCQTCGHRRLTNRPGTG